MEMIRRSQKFQILKDANQWDNVDVNNKLIVLIDDIFGELGVNNGRKEDGCTT